jgi:hypothetical protein
MTLTAIKLKSSGKLFLMLWLFLLLASFKIIAQTDTTATRMNTVRLNITNPLIFGNGAIVAGYERLLQKNQSFSVNIGRTSFPKMLNINTDSIGIDLISSSRERGFNFSVDYRFYMTNENKYPPPRGIYWGPYYSYNYFNRINNWSLNTESFQGDAATELNMNIHTVGVELGYQFVLWERMAIDLILIGPGVGFYSLKAKINTDLSPEDESRLFETIGDYLSQKIPGFDTVVDGTGFEKKGSGRTSTFGFRYMVMIGYRF